MDPDDQSPTLAQLAAAGRWVVWTCMAPGWHGGPLNLDAAEAAERFGPATTIEQVRRRMRCRHCGHRGERIIVEVYTPGRADLCLSNDHVPV